MSKIGVLAKQILRGEITEANLKTHLPSELREAAKGLEISNAETMPEADLIKALIPLLNSQPDYGDDALAGEEVSEADQQGVQQILQDDDVPMEVDSQGETVVGEEEPKKKKKRTLRQCLGGRRTWG